MTKYAIANVIMCSSARTDCWIRVGRKRIVNVDGITTFVVVSGEQQFVLFSSEFGVVVVVANFVAVVDSFCDDGGMMFCLNCCRMYRSYSLDRRRRNSRHMTRRMTPIQEPANMPWEVMRHDLEMKPAFDRTVSLSRQ